MAAFHALVAALSSLDRRRPGGIWGAELGFTTVAPGGIAVLRAEVLACVNDRMALPEICIWVLGSVAEAKISEFRKNAIKDQIKFIKI